MKKLKNIKSFKIDFKYIYIKCKECSKKNKKIVEYEDNEKLNSSYHIYNSYGDFTNRKIKVKSNCLFSSHEYFNLIINKDTLKIKYKELE